MQRCVVFVCGPAEWQTCVQDCLTITQWDVLCCRQHAYNQLQAQTVSLSLS
jgi:hypothetical protein